MPLIRARRRGLVALAAVAVVFGAVALPARAAAADVVVFAAASLKNALDDVAAAFKADTGKGVVASYAASSALAKQIEEGAPADVFVSADLTWMDHLDERGLVRAGTRVDLLGNRIALVAPASSDAAIDLVPGADLAGLLGDGRLAVGETTSVPAGRYARAALESLGLWEGVADRLAEGENVRTALLLVSRGETPLGIVYRTDAAVDPGVRVVALFPADSHPPIVYPAAVTASSGNPDAAGFVDYLSGEKARAIFEAAGFTVLAGPRTN